MYSIHFSFWYQVTLSIMKNASSNGLSISSYSLDGGTTVNDLPENKTLSATVPLGGNGIFTESDVRTIRYYWNWDSQDQEIDNIVYTIIAHVEVKQVL